MCRSSQDLYLPHAMCKQRESRSLAALHRGNLCVGKSSAPKNKKEIKGYANVQRIYKGVGRCLIAFACQYSLVSGLDGYVGLTSKSSKFSFYESMGATPVSNQFYMFNTFASQKLVQKYFPGGILWWPK